MSELFIELGFAPDTAFEPRVVTATITGGNADVALLQTKPGPDGLSEELHLPVTEFFPGRKFVIGDTFQVLQTSPGPRGLASVTCPEFVEALVTAISPEVRAGQVRVMGVSREPGVRAKVAVAATEAGVDPIASCVGRGANRVKYVTSALAGERIDVIAWHPDVATYLRNALAPASVGAIDIDGDRAVAHAPAHQMSAAVGSGGLNSQLAGALVGLNVTIVAD